MRILYFLLMLGTVLYADFPIECEGETQIIYLDAKHKENHTISCFERVEIDLNNNYLRCLTKKHDPKRQIHFHDELHDLYSDQLLAHYIHKEGSLTLDKLKIYGHVCLIQKNNDTSDLAFEELQYALADQLDYDYQKDLITLKSKEDNDVLYYDQVNNYRICADEVLVLRSPETNKAIVEGVGKVRFTFKDDELEKFKKHFFGKNKEFEDARL